MAGCLLDVIAQDLMAPTILGGVPDQHFVTSQEKPGIGESGRVEVRIKVVCKHSFCSYTNGGL